jgi:Uma2 family endonuclease
MSLAPESRMSAEQYLAWERTQLDRHEFFRGEVFEMAGGRLRHGALSAAVIGELRNALRGSEGRVFSSDMRIAARPGEHYVYPDASVVHGRSELEPGTTDVLVNPSVIVEVLSPSTERYDRGLKWESYRAMPSVVDYLLVSQASARIEHYRREAGSDWHYHVAEAGDRVVLSSGAAIEVSAVYEGIFEIDAD